MNTQAMALRLGVDIGGTTIKAGLVDGQGILRFQRNAPTPHSFPACVAAVAELVSELRESASTPAVLGIAVPGVIAPDRDRVMDAPNLRFLDGEPLREALVEACGGGPVLLENDATAAALAEARYGAGRGSRDFLVMTLGTGVGGGLFLNGHPYRGPGGMAGEFGHLPTGHSRTCRCGARGCLEAALSARSLLAWATEEGLAGPNETLPSLAARARSGDLRLREFFDRAGALLGTACAEVALLLDLRVFLVAGGGAPVLDLLRRTALQTLAVRAFGRSAADFRLLPAALGAHAGLYGAALLAEEILP